MKFKDYDIVYRITNRSFTIHFKFSNKLLYVLDIAPNGLTPLYCLLTGSKGFLSKVMLSINDKLSVVVRALI